MTTNLVDWDKLKPYKSDQRKSFEELCYQIVHEEFGKLGKLTSIDDSGGGDGVEFFLTLPNGDEWGWQVKLIDRIDSRKEQIKESLSTAHEKHPNLTRWYLCTKNNLTPDNEMNWFYKELANTIHKGAPVLPPCHKVTLIHWGLSVILNFCRKYPDISRFFFNDKVFTWNWFEDHYHSVMSLSYIQAKYNKELHVSSFADTIVARIYGGKALADLLAQSISGFGLTSSLSELSSSFKDLQAVDPVEPFTQINESVISQLRSSKNLIYSKLPDFDRITKYLLENDFDSFTSLRKDLGEFITEAITQHSFLKELISPLYDDLRFEDKGLTDQVAKNAFHKNRQFLINAVYNYSEAIDRFSDVLEILAIFGESDIYINGHAGSGKTHLAVNIFDTQVSNHRPAIFIRAADLRTNESFLKQIKDQFVLPDDWAFTSFLGALNIAGKVYGHKVPVIIDGLNESIYWQDIWVDDIERLVDEFARKYPFLVLICTYRTTYEGQLFSKHFFNPEKFPERIKRRVRVDGFNENTPEAIKKYFTHYKIKLDARSQVIREFTEPLFLKIFCEIKNPSKQEFVTVSFQGEDLFDIFNEYLMHCTENIQNKLKLDRRYTKYSAKEKLTALAERLWNSNSRTVARSEQIINDNELRPFEGENLIFFRDWAKSGEQIGFTHDLLAGYMIARYLIGKAHKQNAFQIIISKINRNWCTARAFVRSKEFKIRLLNEKTLHPLYEDILRCFSILILKEDGMLLSECSDDPKYLESSVRAAFEVNSKVAVKNSEKIKHLFIDLHRIPDNRNSLYKSAVTIDLNQKHPLSFPFWSDLLMHLPMSERDLHWTEFVRRNYGEVGWHIFPAVPHRLEKECREGEISLSDQHILAYKVMWLLTSTVRKLRDIATKALYWYARRYPKEFYELLKYSLDINDPYVPERMVAVAYGLAMARQNDQDENSYTDNILPLYARFLFDEIFSKDSKHQSTHMLLRDYAKRTIDIAVMHHANLFNQEEKEMIKYPLKAYPHRPWVTSEDLDRDKYRGGNAPIQMDFENYTIGRLFTDRQNYDGNHEGYKLALSNIYWRIYDLGYSLEAFGKIDQIIAGEGWRYGRGNDGEKTDRYGKKYSWIAFYEMAGCRSDDGYLTDWDGVNEFRISDVDIDPSFPEKLPDTDLSDLIGQTSFLGSEDEFGIDWCLRDDLEASRFIFVKALPNHSSLAEWVLLRGLINQKDNDDDPKRDVHLSINTVLLSDEDYEKVMKIRKEYSDINYEYIRIPSHYYLYQGEIPWSDEMPNNGTDELVLQYNLHTVTKERRQLKIFKDNIEISDDEYEKLKASLFEMIISVSKDDNENIEVLENEQESATNGVEEESYSPWSMMNDYSNQLLQKLAENKGYKTKFEMASYTEDEYDRLSINIATTIFESSWESHHSAVIPSGEVAVPSKEICGYHELFIKPQTSDLYDKNGVLASTNLVNGEPFGTRYELTLIRKDLLQEYIRENNQKCLVFQWAEKRYFDNGVKSYVSRESDHEFKYFYRIYDPFDIK